MSAYWISYAVIGDTHRKSQQHKPEICKLKFGSCKQKTSGAPQNPKFPQTWPDTNGGSENI